MTSWQNTRKSNELKRKKEVAKFPGPSKCEHGPPQSESSMQNHMQNGAPQECGIQVWGRASQNLHWNKPDPETLQWSQHGGPACDLAQWGAAVWLGSSTAPYTMTKKKDVPGCWILHLLISSYDTFPYLWITPNGFTDITVRQCQCVPSQRAKSHSKAES